MGTSTASPIKRAVPSGTILRNMNRGDNWKFRAKRPALGSILLGLVPLIAVCLSVSLWDRVYPMVLGIPFNLFWLTSWMLLTPLCMWGAYRLETRRPPHEDGGAP